MRNIPLLNPFPLNQSITLTSIEICKNWQRASQSTNNYWASITCWVLKKYVEKWGKKKNKQTIRHVFSSKKHRVLSKRYDLYVEIFLNNSVSDKLAKLCDSGNSRVAPAFQGPLWTIYYCQARLESRYMKVTTTQRWPWQDSPSNGGKSHVHVTITMLSANEESV